MGMPKYILDVRSTSGRFLQQVYLSAKDDAGAKSESSQFIEGWRKPPLKAVYGNFVARLYRLEEMPIK